jgi:hypothetical protein
MKVLTFLSLCGLATFFPYQANAQGLEGNYFGSTLDPHSTENLLQLFDADSLIQPGDALQIYTNSTPPSNPMQFQGRLDISNFPISVRGMAYTSQDAKALMPTLSYDQAVHRNANIYAGVGYAFVETLGENSDTPVGNQDGVVFTTGIEARVTNNLILFGDAKLRLDATSERIQMEESPVKFQFGLGYGF